MKGNVIFLQLQHLRMTTNALGSMIPQRRRRGLSTISFVFKAANLAYYTFILYVFNSIKLTWIVKKFDAIMEVIIAPY